MNCRGKVIAFGERTYVMGVLNVTPDSFSDGGRFLDVERAVTHAKSMREAGATLIDVGGESSRPGAEPISVDEELSRVLPVIHRLAGELDVILSIDTYKATVARCALEAGAHIVNDITALHGDADMARVVSEMKAGIILMHMKGVPSMMQQHPHYVDVVDEIRLWLQNCVQMAVGQGIALEQVIIDAGIGFGKNTEHNLEILKRLDEFRALNCPLLIGTSRKSFIGNVLALPVTERLEGTAATVCWAISRGVDIVRVHDVKPIVRVARMMDALYRE